MRSWIWLCAIGPAKPDSCSPEVAVSSNLLQRRHHRDRPHLNYGSPGCPCVGLDGLNRTAGPDQALVGTHCDNWTRHCMEETCQAWCFVDPCQCNVSSRPTAATEGFAWQGHALFASSETCNLSLAGSERSKSKKGNSSASPVETPSFCRNFDQDNYGNEKCKRIGIEHLTGNVSAEVDGEKVPYPMDVGSHCSRWDDQPVGICSKEDRPSWCGKNWCYVDPCACAISEPPKVSSYFPKVTYGKKPLYYSYETCGSFDTFTFDSRSACVNQETEAKCLGIGADPDDPELQKCAWGGPEIKCLGKELLHFCQVNDQTIQDWTWWSFSRGDVQRGHMGPAVVTAGIYVLILLFFLMVLRGLL